ncbi:MAG TPA: hypothetical protein VMI31_04360 [Fimbriimonadaceae bacterium]|nr:hypothetical protein [Fimbriimonadaceae bacterium]
MAQKVSRRNLVRGAVGAAVLATAPAILAQETKADPDLDRRLDDAEKQLAHPLDPDVKKLARKALGDLDKELKDRLKTKLPENSEPCFVYVPTTRA